MFNRGTPRCPRCRGGDEKIPMRKVVVNKEDNSKERWFKCPVCGLSMKGRK